MPKPTTERVAALAAAAQMEYERTKAADDPDWTALPGWKLQRLMRAYAKKVAATKGKARGG